jgi:hypothetical protein
LIIKKENFSLDSEDENNNNNIEINLYTQENEKLIKLEDLNKIEKNMKIFSTKYYNQKSYLVIGKKFIIFLKENENLFGYCNLIWKRSIHQILEISFDSSNNSEITLLLRGKNGVLFSLDNDHFYVKLYVSSFDLLIDTLQNNVYNLI